MWARFEIWNGACARSHLVWAENSWYNVVHPVARQNEKQQIYPLGLPVLEKMVSLQTLFRAYSFGTFCFQQTTAEFWNLTNRLRRRSFPFPKEWAYRLPQEKILYTNLGFLSDFPKNILNLDFFGKTGQNLNLENIWETLRYETSTFPNLCSFEKTPSNWVFLRFSPKSFYIWNFFGKIEPNHNLENVWEILRSETSIFPNLCSFEKPTKLGLWKDFPKIILYLKFFWENQTKPQSGKCLGNTEVWDFIFSSLYIWIFSRKIGQNHNLENVWEKLRSETITFPNLCSFENNCQIGDFIGKIRRNLNLENVWEIESETLPFPNLCSFEKKKHENISAPLKKTVTSY